MQLNLEIHLANEQSWHAAELACMNLEKTKICAHFCMELEIENGA